MTVFAAQLLNQGIYTIPEAARLSGVSVWRIRRWLKGYRFKSQEKTHRSQPVWRPELPMVGGEIALSFRDLLEVRYVNTFLTAGVSWPTLREAHERAAELLKTAHPFATRQFATDGAGLFVDLGKEGETSMVEVNRSQVVFADFVRPFIKDLEFSADDVLVRWWPMGKDRLVVIDPKRGFGQPIVAREGVPARVLAEAARRDSIIRVASWYDVSEEEVRDAIEFEQRLAA